MQQKLFHIDSDGRIFYKSREGWGTTPETGLNDGSITQADLTAFLTPEDEDETADDTYTQLSLF